MGSLTAVLRLTEQGVNHTFKQIFLLEYASFSLSPISEPSLTFTLGPGNSEKTALPP